MKMIIKQLSIGFTLCTVAVTTLSAATYTSTGSGNWNDPAAWIGGTVPPSPGATGDTIYMNAGTSISVDSTIVCNPRLTVGPSNSTGSATLLVTTGANLAVNNRIYAGDRSGTHVGTIQIAGGTLQAKGSSGNTMFAIGNSQQDLGSTGQLLITGGDLRFNSNTMVFSVALNNNKTNSWAVGTVSQAGGSVSGNAYLQVANNSVLSDGYSLSAQISLLAGSFSISGQVTNSNTFGNNAVTSGAHAALTVSSNMDTVYLGNNTNFSGNDTKLILDLAQLSSWTGKTVMQFGGTLTFNGAAGVVVDLSNFGLWEGADVGDTVTITLLSYNSLSKTTSTADTITGLDTDHFSAGNITWGANAATIDVTYTNAIPEPAVAAGALGLLALAMAVRRRRV